MIRAEVLAATRLHCSVGIGDNKLRAKIATDFGKPRGVWQLTADNWFEVMGDRPTDGAVGSRLARPAKKLAALGIDTVDQLAALRRAGARRARSARRWGRGSTGSAAACDPSPVDATPWVPRAHGREETFQQDLEDWAEVEAAVRALTGAGGGRHRPRGPAGGPGRAQGPVQAVLHASPAA